MRHLSREDLLTRADGGALTAAAEGHLRGCLDCQGEVAQLEVTLGRVREADVPEPSPLFWEHLAAHVGRAVAQEPSPRAAISLPGWRWWAPASGLAAAVVALVVAVATPIDVPVTRPAAPAAAQAVVASASEDESGGAWALVVDVLAAADAGEGVDLGVAPSSAEFAAADLSDEDQARLVKVLNDELTKPL
jgi:hypothetical protein